MRLKGMIITVFLLAGLFYGANADAVSVSIDKPHINVEVSAGEVDSGVIVLKNRGKDPLSVQVNLEDWYYDEKGERVFALPGTTPLSCANWIDINPRVLVVPAGESVTFNYTVKVPENAEGGHYAVIFFEAHGIEEEGVEGSGIMVVGRIGSIVYQETKGKSRKSASILSSEVSAPDQNNPLILTYRFKNTGNIFIRSAGTINIVDDKGNTRGNAQSKSDIGTLPDNIREDEIRWFGTLPKGTYDVVLTVDIGKDAPPLVAQKTVTVEQDIE